MAREALFVFGEEDLAGGDFLLPGEFEQLPAELAGKQDGPRELASEWKARLLSQDLSPSTVNGKLSAVNSLFRFLGWEDCRVKFLKLQRRAFRDASRDLTRGEFERLRAAADGSLVLLLGGHAPPRWSGGISASC